MPYLLIAPALLFCLLWRVLPLLLVAGLSFYETDWITTSWAGLANYRRILTDTELSLAIPNTLWYLIGIVPATVGLALLVASSARREPERVQHVVRFTVYLPALVSGIVMATVWRWVFAWDGPINSLLLGLGGERVIWFATRLTAIGPISFIETVSGLGYFVIVLMAALQAVPPEHFDIATLEGASRAQVRRYVMIPAIAPTVAVVTMLKVGAALQIFGWVYMLAPYPYAATMMYATYREAFLYGRFGTGAAFSVILMVVTVAAIALQRRASRW